jgi:hypothetical protein
MDIVGICIRSTGLSGVYRIMLTFATFDGGVIEPRLRVPNALALIFADGALLHGSAQGDVGGAPTGGMHVAEGRKEGSSGSYLEDDALYE